MSIRCPNCSHLRDGKTCHARLTPLLTIARTYPVGSLKRNRLLTQVIREITPHLWRVDTFYYADALQQTWLYFAQHGCTRYDGDRGCLVAWLNSYLRYRHRDLQVQAIDRWKQELSLDSSAYGKDGYIGMIGDLPSRMMASLELLDQVQDWAETDMNGVLQRTHVRNHPQANAQALILLRLPPETRWKEISTHFQISIPTLNQFYQTKCLRLLRQFGHQEGFLESA
jgi:hypothetical protein